MANSIETMTTRTGIIKKEAYAASLGKEDLQSMYDAKVLQDDFWRPAEGMFGTVWDVSASLVLDKKHPVSGDLFTDLDIRVTVGGKSTTIWSSQFLNAVVLPASVVGGMQVVDKTLNDPIFYWDELNNLPSKRIKDMRLKDGSLPILRSYRCIGGLVSKSVVPEELGRRYRIPFYGFSDGVDFLRYYNAKNGTTFRSLREQIIVESLGKKFVDKEGNTFLTPSELVIRGEYGKTPYLSPITPIFEEYRLY
jgi:hypothetical protein